MLSVELQRCRLSVLCIGYCIRFLDVALCFRVIIQSTRQLLRLVNAGLSLASARSPLMVDRVLLSAESPLGGGFRLRGVGAGLRF